MELNLVNTAPVQALQCLQRLINASQTARYGQAQLRTTTVSYELTLVVFPKQIISLVCSWTFWNPFTIITISLMPKKIINMGLNFDLDILAFFQYIDFRLISSLYWNIQVLSQLMFAINLGPLFNLSRNLRSKSVDDQAFVRGHVIF